MRNGELVEKPLLLASESSFAQEDIGALFFPSSIEVSKDALALPLVGNAPGFRGILGALREMRAYSIVPDLLREPQDSDEGRILRVDGRNATSVWRDLDPEDRGELIALLGHAVPGIEDVRTQRYGRKRGFEFLQTSGSGRNRFEGHQMSDGTLRLFGILLALLQRRPSSVIAVEEPEASLHVAALEALIGMMRERVASGQVLLTTHSPELIDFVSADELRLVRREEGHTIVAPLASHTKKVVRDELFTLGELHRAGGLRAAGEPLSTSP
jgi:predicted ATPase